MCLVQSHNFVRHGYKFEPSQVVFKCFTVYVGGSTENGKTILGYLFHELHDRYDIMKCFEQGNVLLSVVLSATNKCNLEAQIMGHLA